jgi:hypothetical protein
MTDGRREFVLRAIQRLKLAIGFSQPCRLFFDLLVGGAPRRVHICVLDTDQASSDTENDWGEVDDPQDTLGRVSRPDPGDGDAATSQQPCHVVFFVSATLRVRPLLFADPCYAMPWIL